jgi:hypothetical protein
MYQPQPAKVRTIDADGQPVRCVETDDGKRTWLCDCEKFKERAARSLEGFCAHTAVAISRCVDDGTIERPVRYTAVP